MADIPASTPLVIPEVITPAKTFDIWVVPFMSFTWTGSTGPLIGDVTFQRARRDPETLVTEWAEEKVNMRVDDTWTLAAADQDVATALQTLLAAVTKVGMEKGLL